MGPQAFTPFERFLQLLTKVRPGEGRTVALFSCHVFLILFAYYILKSLREGVVLAAGSAVDRSMNVAFTAAVLMLFVPLYSAMRRRHDGPWLVNGVIGLFALSAFGFWILARTGRYFPLAFYVWVGIFGVALLAQFWALAADSFNVKSGQRLFPAILLFGNFGALAGTRFCEYLIDGEELGVVALGVDGMLLTVAATLGLTTLLTVIMREAVPPDSRAVRTERAHRVNRWLGGFDVVRQNRYLMLIAVMVVLINWCTSTGDFLLSSAIERQYESLVAAGATTLDEATYVTKFMANFLFWMTLVGLVFQALLVSRSIQAFGVPKVLLVMPVISFLAYALISFVPLLSIVRLARMAEASADYSFNNTTRHSLFLATDRVETYDGKTTIETFFWRFGDLLQFGAVWLNFRYGGGDLVNLALLNCALASVWFASAVVIGREYGVLARQNMPNAAPRLTGAIPTAEVRVGERFEHHLPPGLFEDADPGDVLTLSACCADGSPLPAWLAFDRHRQRFHGLARELWFEELRIEVTATDHDGESVSSVFVIRRLTVA